jgi:hypothetical protein
MSSPEMSVEDVGAAYLDSMLDPLLTAAFIQSNPPISRPIQLGVTAPPLSGGRWLWLFKVPANQSKRASCIVGETSARGFLFLACESSAGNDSAFFRGEAC